jgi:hypothetical protein
VITRLAGEITHAQPVLHNQHAIAVQAANHRACRARPEAAERDARLVLNRRAKRALQLFRQLLPAEHGRRLKRFELIHTPVR